MCIAPVHVERLRTMVRRIEFDACRVDMGLECWLCLRVKNRAQAAQIAYELKDKAMEMVAEIKRKTKARSKDANAYAWELMGQMADLLHTDKDCALPGFVDSKNEEKTERNAGYLVVSHSGGGMLRQGTRKGIRRTPANRGMRAHWVVKGLDISEDVCHGMCP